MGWGDVEVVMERIAMGWAEAHEREGGDVEAM
jgi:hypothetical protein